MRATALRSDVSLSQTSQQSGGPPAEAAQAWRVSRDRRRPTSRRLPLVQPVRGPPRRQPLRRTTSPGCWCPGRGSPPVFKHDGSGRFSRQPRRPRCSSGLPTVPVCTALSDQPVSPIEVSAGLDGTDGGDRSPPFGDREANPGTDSFQVAAQVSFELPDPNALHNVTTSVPRCSHIKSVDAVWRRHRATIRAFSIRGEEMSMTYRDTHVADPPFNLTAATAALDHARSMANYSAEVRMRSFNFFVVITAALLTGLAQLPERWSLILGVGGAIVALFFYGLDVRARGLHKRSISCRSSSLSSGRTPVSLAGHQFRAAGDILSSVTTGSTSRSSSLPVGSVSIGVFRYASG